MYYDESLNYHYDLDLKSEAEIVKVVDKQYPYYNKQMIEEEYNKMALDDKRQFYDN